MSHPTLSDDFVGQRQRRIDKVAQLRALGVDPYPAHSRKDVSHAEIKAKFVEFDNKELVLAGRLVSLRDHGKLIFADLQDQTGRIQLYIKQDTIVEDLSGGFLGWDKLTFFDVGDYVEAHGTVMKTSRGEISLQVTHLRMLTKTIRPLPNSLTEKEDQFRRRYLDLTVNPERKEQFFRKAKFWQVSRAYMDRHGFMEVEVPVLEHVTGGADARPFVTHHNDLDQDFYMRISTELYQKRLIGAGFEKIYTLGPNFRNEGLSDEHLQEYSQLEWYWAYADYRDNMTYVRDMIRHVAQEVWGTTKFSSRGHEFDLNDDWNEVDYAGVIKERFGVDIFTDSDEKMQQVVKEQGIDLPGVVNRARLIDNLWKAIRRTIAGPAFLVNEPKFMSPLAKSKPDNPELTERFHIIIGGSELGNGYSEINDPRDQLDRFLDQQNMRDQGDDEAQMLDIDFVEMLEYGMPPTSGYAHSERLFWYLENVTAREGTFFPQLKHEVEPMTRTIYAEELERYNITLDKTASTFGPEQKAGKSEETMVAHAVILDTEDLPGWAKFNTVAHLSAAMAAREGKKLIHIEQSKTLDGEVIPMNIQHAIMIKTTDKAHRLLTLKRQAEEAGMHVVCFTRDMMATSDDRKVRDAQEAKSAEQIEFLGVLVFGKKTTVEHLTRNFSLSK
jgi:lysyl-tRNA synthetase class 2